MAIDGVGKPPISGAPNSVDAADIPRGASRAEFVVKSASGPDAASAAETVDGSLVNQLQSGQITRNQYLDIRADQAVHHLVGRVSAEQLDLIRAALREQLSTDPLLINMVRRATSMLGQR